MRRAARALATAAAGVLAGLLLVSCKSPIPHLVWPQKDLVSADYNDPSLDRRVLVAARASGFKAEVVRLLVGDLTGDRVFVRLVGVNQLRHVPANQYQAVVILSTTMARTLDPKVTGFLERVRDKSRVILITTSSGGDWLPDKGAYDAISAASRAADAPGIAAEAAAAVRRRLAQ
jgi:hypothetical protein